MEEKFAADEGNRTRTLSLEQYEMLSEETLALDVMKQNCWAVSQGTQRQERTCQP
jgi:hypothetical protein